MTIEAGGFGADAAAPAAREILDELLDVNQAKIEDVSAAAANGRMMEVLPPQPPSQLAAATL